MSVATVSSKGWIVIPNELRKRYNLRAGARVAIVDYGGVLSIVPAMTDPVARRLDARGRAVVDGRPARERAQERACER